MNSNIQIYSPDKFGFYQVGEYQTLVSLEGSKVKDSYANIEQYSVAIPNIIALSEKYKFDYTVIDFSKFIMDYIATNARYENILYDINFNLSPNNIAKSLLRYNVDKWKNLILSGKKVCFLWGMEKLIITDRGGNNYLKFLDRYDCVLSPIVQRNYSIGWYDEFFSITPDLPELMIKQCNIIKNFFKIRNTNLYSVLSYYQQEPSFRGYNKRLNLYLSDDGYRKLLYPYWDLNTLSRGKSASTSKSLQDDWIWNGNMIQKDIFLDSHKIFETKTLNTSSSISANEYII